MISALLLLAALPQQVLADPLEPARRGLIRCISPDRAARTCVTMVRYTPSDDGRFEAVVTGLVTSDPSPVVLEYRTWGLVRDDAVCSVVKASDFAAGRLSTGGAPLAPALEARLRARFADGVAPLAGKMRCFRERIDGDERTATVTLDGQVQPDMIQQVIWVSPEEGFTVGD